MRRSRTAYNDEEDDETLREMEDEVEFPSSTTEVVCGYERIPVINTKTGAIISGAAAPMKRNLESYLRKRPHLQVWVEGINETVPRPFAECALAPTMAFDSVDLGEDLEGSSVIGGSMTNTASEQHGDYADSTIFDSLNSWSEAVEAMSKVMDRSSCGSLLEEIADLQHDVSTRRCTPPSQSLKAFVDCKFPAICIKIMTELEKASDKSFQNHVTTIMDAFTTVQDPTCVGTNEIADLLSVKSKQLQELSSRIENHGREKDRLRQQQQNLADETLRELETTTEALWTLQNEKESIEAALLLVRTKASKQKLALERQLERNGGSEQFAKENSISTSTRVSETSSSCILSAALGRQQEKACAVVAATQDHIDLVHRTADFVREAGDSVNGLIRSMIKRSLENELTMLQQDQAHLAYFAQHLKGTLNGDSACTSGIPQALLTPSVAVRYKCFYLAQLQSIGARHILSRYAARGLIAYLKGLGCQLAEEDNEIMELAQKVIVKIDAMKNCESEAPSAVEILAPGSLVAFCSEPSAIQQVSQAAASQCLSALTSLSAKQSCKGRLKVRHADLKLDDLQQMCELFLAFSKLRNLPGEIAKNIEKELTYLTQCTCNAASWVLSGGCRQSICILHTTEFSREEVSPPASTLDNSLSPEILGVTIMYAKMHHTWLENIAVIDLFNPSHVPETLLGDTSVRFFSLFPNQFEESHESQHLMQLDSDRDHDDKFQRWKNTIDTVSAQVSAFQPQMIVAHVKCSRNRSGWALSRTLSLEDWKWVGKMLSQLSSASCDGRLVAIWDLAGGAQLWQNSIASMTEGMMNIGESCPQ